MSRHLGASRHRPHGSSSRNTDGNPEDVIEQVKGIVGQLYEVVSERPQDWETYLASARSAVTALDHLHFFRNPQRYAEQAWILHGLQDYAFHDPDAGSIRDIAEWAQKSWLRVLRNFPENENRPESEEILTGLGRNWLQTSQATLARIQREEAAASADPRCQGPLYVEAREYLQPAVDYYTRAVRSADALGNITGDLLAQAAESQMSLGNVTPSPNDERHFTQAVRYLRRAEAMPGYTLSVYLQQYLNDYGRYVS